MDRRQFLAVGGLAAATPVLGQGVGAGSMADTADGLFKRVNLVSDGLGLDSREYATLLHEAAMADGFGTDYYSLGGPIAALERKFANLLGKDAAMFVPTGTLANHLAIRKLAGNDRRVLVQAESHLYNDSGDCAQTLSGLNLIPLASGRTTIDLAEIRSWVERSAGGRVETKVGALSIENPVRRMNHQMVDLAELERVCGYARQQGIRLHMDGARMFNLPFHSGKSIRDYAALFDTVYVSLWKHFNGASGAILAGDSKFIDGLFHMRRMFGGALPHAWPQVAFVERYVDSYEDEYAKSWRATDKLIELLQTDGRFKVHKMPEGTSTFFLAVSDVAAEVLSERALRRGVILPAQAGSGMLALQVNPSVLRMAPAALAQVFFESMVG